MPTPPRCIPVLQTPQRLGPVAVGRVSAEAGQAAADCVVWAAQAALRKEIGAIVTAPLHKEALAAAGISYPGHTELLQAQAGRLSRQNRFGRSGSHDARQ
jgi:4-hydroxythreonine-4-phosphate dehydrogenase